MTFRVILHELLATTRGAMAVIFLDWEGETVELVCDRDVSDHDLRIIGAYQGIFLTRLRELCVRLVAGPPQRFKLELAAMTLMTFDLKDGYYIVLMMDAAVNEGLAWRNLEACRSRLLEEM